MNLRFSARGDGHDTVVHLTVSDTLRFGRIVGRRGEALCRPSASLPNLDLLPRQLLDNRQCCRACIAVKARPRVKRDIILPASVSIVAAGLNRLLSAGAKLNGLDYNDVQPRLRTIGSS